MPKSENLIDFYKQYPNASLKEAAIKFNCALNTIKKQRYELLKKGLLEKQDNNQRFKEINVQKKIVTPAKILILDIETAPILAHVWGIWQQNINLDGIVSDWFVLTWAAKWLFEDKVYSGVLTSKEAINQNDKRIIQGIWQLVNEADCVIAHNGQKFDMKKLNSRFLIHNLPPPLPYHQIDTLLHFRKQFGFSSNKLDYINKLLNLPRKLENDGLPLWCGCLRGEKDSLQKMVEYNIGDVRILEETYLRIRPWIKPHINLGLFILNQTQSICPSCGSNHLIEEGKKYYTTVEAYEQYRCGNCGAVARKRKSSLTIKEKRFVLSSSPR